MNAILTWGQIKGLLVFLVLKFSSWNSQTILIFGFHLDALTFYDHFYIYSEWKQQLKSLKNILKMITFIRKKKLNDYFVHISFKRDSIFLSFFSCWKTQLLRLYSESYQKFPLTLLKYSTRTWVTLWMSFPFFFFNHFAIAIIKRYIHLSSSQRYYWIIDLALSAFFVWC